MSKSPQQTKWKQNKNSKWNKNRKYNNFNVTSIGLLKLLSTTFIYHVAI